METVKVVHHNIFPLVRPLLLNSKTGMALLSYLFFIILDFSVMSPLSHCCCSLRSEFRVLCRFKTCNF